MSPFLAEFVGTTILIILGNGVVAGNLLNRSKAQNAGWVSITLAWGLAVCIAIYAVGKYSGAHINPAVTLALASDGQFPWRDVPGFIIAQFLGAFVGGILVYLHYLSHWDKTSDAEVKLAVFATGPAIRNPFANMLSEAIGTALLLVGIVAISANELAIGFNPLLVGLLIVSIGLSLGGPTGYAINPARDFGPRIAHFLLPIPGKGSSDFAYAPVPIIGPFVGGIFGIHAYKALFEGSVSPTLIVFSLAIVGFIFAAFAFEKKAENEVLSTADTLG